MKGFILSFTIFATTLTFGAITETVYVESPTDTDGDGVRDLIYVTVERDANKTNLPVIYKITPYALGGNDTDFHSTDVELLPQDEKLAKSSRLRSSGETKQALSLENDKLYQGYAKVSAHSVGTGSSTGCPTVGDMSETLAGKAVIDWLNGRAKAFNKSGEEVTADWASGNVGMIGVSYNGTLPTMIASTGVEGLKAIVPIAAISSWYDYYRANGLVVNPGGYIGEDADILGKFIVRRNACGREISDLTLNMGRENGDFTKFWADRDYLPQAKNIKAATFVVHGQSDWNVKQKHAIQLWEALPASTPKRMYLHKGAHANPSNRAYRKNVEKWFDYFVKGEQNDVLDQKPIRVQSMSSSRVTAQDKWPHENTSLRKVNLGSDGSQTIIDQGRDVKMYGLTRSPETKNDRRIIFLSEKLTKDTLISGTINIELAFALKNRRAANISVALIDYGSFSSSDIITRGWADAQNFQDITSGELLEIGKKYTMKFPLEPKQYVVEAGHKIGLLITSTDYNYTLRPKVGTEIEFFTGSESFIEIYTDNGGLLLK